MSNLLITRQLNSQQPYLPIWHAMQQFSQQRDANVDDELWLLEHPPVFTQGLAGKKEHLLTAQHTIPIVQTDRGGQVTYHGPGQLMAYSLFDVKRLAINTREFVVALEEIVIELLKDYGITAHARRDAPGVYVNAAKICSIGLRIKRGCAYHGICLNVNADLSPFQLINPCGFQGLKMAQLADFIDNISVPAVSQQIIPYFIAKFGYNQARSINQLWEQPHDALI